MREDWGALGLAETRAHLLERLVPTDTAHMNGLLPAKARVQAVASQGLEEERFIRRLVALGVEESETTDQRLPLEVVASYQRPGKAGDTMRAWALRSVS